MTNKNYEKWLRINNKTIHENLLSMNKEQIENAFSGELKFGTAGLRGIMELGTNRLNAVNVCKLASALCSIYKAKKLSSIIIGFDTRHNSKLFSRIFARVMADENVKVNLFKSFVPTPVLVYGVTATNSDMGIMITASHNSKIYNGIKVVDANGIQISGDIEKQLGINYDKIDEVDCFNNFINNKLHLNKNIKYVSKNVKSNFIGKIYKNKLNKELNVIYTPLNGTGYHYVMNVLKQCGFNHVKSPLSQKKASGNFTTCPSLNPEFEVAYKRALKCTENFDADIIVATDPDADRLGVMIKSTKGYKLLTGNEVGFLFLNYIYETRAREKNLYAVSTVVSSPMFFDMCDYYKIKYEKSLTGFKNIGQKKLALEGKYGKDGFIVAYEESCGYIVKDSFYDKDGIFATLKICEIASYLKNRGSSVEEYLNEIYNKFGNMYSLNSNLAFNGENALKDMNDFINKLREKGLKTLLKKKIINTIDYLNDKTGLEKSNFIEYIAKDFSFIIRPSGTEPKIKFYIHAKGKNLQDSKEYASELLMAIKKEIFNINE